jgi:hypothetical protein
MTTTTLTVAEIQQAGVTIEPHEAVAIAQQLIDALRDHGGTSVLEPPYGPPSAANVLLKGDGTVLCRRCGTTPAILEVAILLQSLLGSTSSRMPGGLRYTIARALLEVDMAPFDSLEDFSQSLARFECGPRDEAVRALLRRFEDLRPAAAPASTDRRRIHPVTTDLRRALREADAQLYLQKCSVERQRAAAPAPPSRSAPAAAACAVAGLLLIATGEFTHLWHQRTPARPASAARDIMLVGDPAPRQGTTLSAATPAPKMRVVATSRDVAPPSIKRDSHPTRTQTGAARARRPSTPGLLDRLKLHWLRNMFASRAD